MLTLLSLLSGFLLIPFLSEVIQMDITVSIIIVLFSICFIFDINKSRYKKYAIPMVFGLVFRIALLYYDVFSDDFLNLPLVGGELSSDPLRFYNAAVNIAQGNSSSYGGMFSRFFGTIFSFTGASRLWGEFIVLLFSIALFLVFALISDELFVDDKTKTRNMYFLCLLPNFAFLSVVFRRETIITFFVSLSILYFIRWVKNNGKVKYIVSAIGFALLASLFHGGTGMIIIGYALIRLIYDPQRARFTLDTKNILSTVILFLVFLFLYARYGTVLFGKIESRLSSGSLSSVRNAGGSSYARYVGDSRTPARMLLYAVPRFLYYLFSPFPWQWRGLGDIITFVFSSCVYLIIYIRSILNIKRMDKDNPNRSLLIVLFLIATIITAVFSWGVTNTGTATRHRDKFLIVFLAMNMLSSYARDEKAIVFKH